MVARQARPRLDSETASRVFRSGPSAALTVDRDRESAADLAHAGVGETAESIDEDADRDALNRVQTYGRTPGIGSSSGSRTTSLGSARIAVVHGATSTRRSRGIAASLTTGRRPISASSQHHTSPRAQRAFTMRQPPGGTTPGRPTRPARRAGARRRWRSSRPPRRHGGARPARPGPRRSVRHP
jgi:hypothetical protein